MHIKITVHVRKSGQVGVADTENNEIVCFVNESQEVYSINTSWMRRTGITMTTENKSMSALSRSFAVTLVATDEIKIKAT
ncbi:MAG: hypothetical protein II341_10160, partial [Oscillospiraceae bacterium]|nr:hypothetical protein [Oscillospiraceae bacterium]